VCVGGGGGGLNRTKTRGPPPQTNTTITRALRTLFPDVRMRLGGFPGGLALEYA
jgi:hypothetical protein